jgi:type VI secretion system protein ImpH
MTGFAYRGSFGWRGEGSVRDWLFAEPYRFNFFQAVRLLEFIQPHALSPGAGGHPEQEAVRFHSRVTFEFPGSDVQALTPAAGADARPEMTVNFMSLGGAFGPLAAPDSELIVERSWYKDYGLREFLDIFNHRLVALMYQIRKAHHVALTACAPDQGAVAGHLFSLLGLGLPALRDRLPGLPDRALLYYSGLLAKHPRSAIGLERLLSDYFQARVRVRQLEGVWRHLDASEWTRIGASGRNRTLGRDVVVGTRIWDQQGRFELRLGPLPLPRFRDFLPTGKALRRLCALTRFYAGPEFEFSFRLTIEAAEAPEARLGSAQLGWTSWLKTRPFRRDDSQVELRPIPDGQ